MILRSLITVGAFLTMMGITFSSMAVSYSPDIKNCSLTKVGNHTWQAKFNIVINRCYTCENTEYNWVSVNVPMLNDKGKPAGSSYSDRVSEAKWSNLTLNGAVKARVNSNSIFINGDNDNEIIYNDANVIVNFSTEGNNAYPAVFIYIAHSPGSPGGFFTWIFLDSAGACYGYPQVPATIPPITEVDPVEPEFKMKSAIWNMDAVDIGDLPNATAAGNGYTASIRNVASNSFCVSYVTTGVKNNSYALGVTNNYSTEYGRNVFMMKNGDGQLLYNLKLISNDGVINNNFDFPSGSIKYITLSQSGGSTDNRSEMCWTPQIELFKNSTTVGGYYSDILNFIVTPKA